ncbi:MAG: PLP-dependent aspartate aminotransferase family protein [Clostridiales bacterium]|jgi:cystathionine gamma-synthase|nr:PLP-dependent aspartate aminotransferase family protein [Clostridiales bacterium]
MRLETTCVHAARDATHTTGAVAAPIYQSSTFARDGLGDGAGYDYSRLQNPTREHAEKIMAALESGADALGFASGMAAISAFAELFAPGDGIIASNDLYGGSIRLFEYVARKNGVSVTYVDGTEARNVAAALTERTKAVFIETPTNPMLNVTDVAAVRALLPDGVILAVDNTFLTPYFLNPLALGADIVIHSATKYLAGHNDTLAGFLVPKTAELAERLRFIQRTTGGVLAPFDAFLVARGVKTLAVRMEKAQANALAVALWLRRLPRVEIVRYLGLAEHPAHELSKRQGRGFGSMISFTVDSAETARAALSRAKLILFAESLGGTETLITYPATQTHADVPEAERAARGITDRLLRLSVGIEAADDIIEDLAGALK